MDNNFSIGLFSHIILSNVLLAKLFITCCLQLPMTAIKTCWFIVYGTSVLNYASILKCTGGMHTLYSY